MKVIDLTLPIADEMPVYSDDPHVNVTQAATVESDGIMIHTIHMGTHTGTHIDAPAHILSDGKTLNEFPVDHFMGKALVVSVEEGLLTSPHLGELVQELTECEILLVHTGHDKYFGTEDYYKQYAGIDPDAAKRLLLFNLKAVGGDFPSVDYGFSLETHKTLLGADILIYEGLTNLEKAPQTGGYFCGLPLALDKTDGAPVRAVMTF